MGYILKIGDNIPSIGKNILANLNTVIQQSYSYGAFHSAVNIKIHKYNNTYYVSNYTNGTVNIVDKTTDVVISTVTGFTSPRRIEIDYETNLYYVCNTTSIRVMDVMTNTQVGSLINVTNYTYDLCLNTEGGVKYLYLTHYNEGYIRKLRLSDNVTVKLITGIPSPKKIIVDSLAGVYYVLCYAQSIINVYTITDDVFVKNIPVFNSPYAGPHSFDFDYSSGLLYISNFGNGAIVNASTGALVSVITLVAAQDVVLDTPRKTIYGVNSETTINKYITILS